MLIAFIIKHFICDFPLQRWEYMYKNKGTYFHAGGLLHAGIHGIITFIIILYTQHVIIVSLFFSLLDFLIHYHVDWAKIKICKKFNLKPENSEWYWHVLGFDQMLHYLTYAGIIWLLN